MTGGAGRARWARRMFILVAALAFVGVLATALIRAETRATPGKPAPRFRARVLGGSDTLALDDMNGKPVVLNFWASWCEPCKDEARLLNDAHAAYGDRIRFVGVNIRDARSEALAFLERFDVAYPSVRDVGLKIYDDYGLTGQPETFFIDADGVVVTHVPGPLFAEDLSFLIRELLDS